MMRGRRGVALMLVASLALTFLMRGWAQSRRETLSPRPRAQAGMKGANTFALGLILGGLRGPLAMILWTSSETQKVERDLESIDTKIDLIRMLQPEFDSVLLYQIWNKAYNLSVQMASLRNKYYVILDALRYAREADAERPDNVNILAAMADVYFNKLGQSTEKRQYSQFMSRDTLPHRSAASTARSQAVWRRTEHETWLDERGFILPELLKSRLAGARGEYNGAELQYLARYNTQEMGAFPYGLPPVAAGFNYYRRAAQLQKDTGQRHVQLSDSVIDSRPAVSLMYWAKAERLLGRRNEMAAAGLQVPEDEQMMDIPTASLPVNGKLIGDADAAKRLLDEAIFNYRRTGQVARHAMEEYRRHLLNPDFSDNLYMYASHADEMTTMETEAAADEAYLSLVRAHHFEPNAASERMEELKKKAAEGYRDARRKSYLLMLMYFTDDEIADQAYPEAGRKVAGKPYTKATLNEAPMEVLLALHRAAQEVILKIGYVDGHTWEIQEFETAARRAELRLEQLAK